MCLLFGAEQVLSWWFIELFCILVQNSLISKEFSEEMVVLWLHIYCCVKKCSEILSDINNIKASCEFIWWWNTSSTGWHSLIINCFWTFSTHVLQLISKVYECGVLTDWCLPSIYKDANIKSSCLLIIFSLLFLTTKPSKIKQPFFQK